MTKELQERLLAIQAELKAPKGQFNKFGNYKYRSAEDILEAVKPLCQSSDLLLTLSDELVCIGERYYIKATATIIHGESEFSVTAYAREEENKKGMDGSQITGTASSYARKYALNGLFLIDDTKDADTNAYREQQDRATKKKTDKITAADAKNLTQLIELKGKTVENMLAYVNNTYNTNYDKVEDLTTEIYTAIFNMLKEK